MSLINQMLQDLEKRQDDPDVAEHLPHGVRSALPEPVPAWGKRGWPVAALLVLALGGSGAFYWSKFHPAESAPQVQAALLPEPPVIAAALPGIPVAAPPAPAEQKPVASPRAALHPVPAALKEKDNAAVVASRANLRAAQRAALPVRRSTTGGEENERSEGLYHDALSAFEQGHGAESQGLARKVLEIAPGHIGARQLLVRQLLEQRASESARNELKQGLQYQPAQTLWATWLVRLELEQGDLTAARQVIDQALPYAESQPDFLSLAGAVAQRQGKPAEAADFYRAVLRLRAADGRAWVGLGLALEGDGHVPEAKEAFRRALSVEGLSPELAALAQRKLR